MKQKKGMLRSGRQCVMAVVLGTALASLGSAAESSRAEISSQAIQDLSRYCTACWRNARLPVDRWGDCTQEVLRRLLERVPPENWDQMLTGDSDQKREFLRAIDAVKKQTQRERQRTINLEDAVPDVRDRVERHLLEEREVLQQAAGTLLSPRQQRILQLTCDGWSIADIAARLNLPCDRTSDEKYKAIQKLRRSFASVEA